MRILIVEDEQKLAIAIKTGLEQESMAIDLAGDGQTGLDLAISESYDLIILDLMLPVIDGKKICQTLRQEKITTPILMLTALSQITDKVEGLNCGADDYLTKPFDFEELLARIKALTRRNGDKQVILTADDLELDSINYQVKRANKQIDLSKKEFALLEYLLKNKDRVMTKQQLIDHIWDFDADVLPNTVEVMIGNLRKKIDHSYPTKLLQTVRGFGYKIEDKNV